MPGHLKGPHSLESSCRYETGVRIGDANVEYEFDIKIPPIDVDMTDDEFEREAREEIAYLKRKLRDRYSWIGAMGQTRRSGGWFFIQDRTGGATKAKLQKIIDIISSEKKMFVKLLEKHYPSR